MGKRLVSGLTLLFQEEAKESQENSSSIVNGGAMLENSVVKKTKTDMESVVKHVGTANEKQNNAKSCFFMPLHYPLFTKEDYENMQQWKLDQLFTEYGLISMVGGDFDLDYKRKFAMGAFLWP